MARETGEVQQMLQHSHKTRHNTALRCLGNLWRQGSLQQRQAGLQAAAGSRLAFISKCTTLAVSVCGRGQPWLC